VGFFSEWALQCYRAVMFPVHWLLGLDAHAVSLDDAIFDEWEAAELYVCGCPGQDCEECLNHTTPTNS